MRVSSRRLTSVATPYLNVAGEYSSHTYNLKAIAAAATDAFRVELQYPHSPKHLSDLASSKAHRPLVVFLTIPKPVVNGLANDGRVRVAAFHDGSIVTFGSDKDEDFALVRQRLSDYAEPRDPAMVPPRGVRIDTQVTVNPDASVAADEDEETDELELLEVASVDFDSLLPLSFCILELLQLKAINALVLPVAKNASRWQERVMGTGRLPMSLKEARVMKALVLRLTSMESRLAMQRQALFREGGLSSQREQLNSACDFFELSVVREEVRERLDVVHRTLAYLSEEAHADTNHHLEIVIIVLICMHVALALQGSH